MCDKEVSQAHFAYHIIHIFYAHKNDTTELDKDQKTRHKITICRRPYCALKVIASFKDEYV